MILLDCRHYLYLGGVLVRLGGDNAGEEGFGGVLRPPIGYQQLGTRIVDKLTLDLWKVGIHLRYGDVHIEDER